MLSYLQVFYWTLIDLGPSHIGYKVKLSLFYFIFPQIVVSRTKCFMQKNCISARFTRGTFGQFQTHAHSVWCFCTDITYWSIITTGDESDKLCCLCFFFTIKMSLSFSCHSYKHWFVTLEFCDSVPIRGAEIFLFCRLLYHFLTKEVHTKEVHTKKLSFVHSLYSTLKKTPLTLERFWLFTKEVSNI